MVRRASIVCGEAYRGKPPDLRQQKARRSSKPPTWSTWACVYSTASTSVMFSRRAC